jgi:hypothetical protein
VELGTGAQPAPAAVAGLQRQLGHANLGITSIYLQGIDNSEIINTVYARPAPMLPASAGLRWASSSEARASKVRRRL